MRRYLLDSNSLPDCIFRRKGVDVRAAEVRARGDPFGTAITVVAELLAGTESSTTRDKNLPVVNRGLTLFRIWPFDLSAAREYGRLFAELRRTGGVVPPMDLTIASIALTLPNCTVVTTDSDLSRVPGPRVENWAS